MGERQRLCLLGALNFGGAWCWGIVAETFARGGRPVPAALCVLPALLCLYGGVRRAMKAMGEG